MSVGLVVPCYNEETRLNLEYWLRLITEINQVDWIFVDDHTQGLWLAFTKGIDGGVYNFGGDQELSNIALVKLILDILQKPHSLIEFVSDRKGHDFRYGVDNTRSFIDLGWRPEQNFKEKLNATISWYKTKLQA